MALKLHRRCVSCQCIALRDNFWRVVRVPIAPEQNDQDDRNDRENVHQHFQIQLDQGMGRSAYLCQKIDCLQIAQKKNRLGRSLRTHIPPEIFDILKSRLELINKNHQTQ
ncbi:YlxR family protein [Pseudanabaena sp. 'Roaring Creek']|uniref:YlxR family protein n=1 Tax=Pseudanabaena sp. 'Roaring Creek' TaxID=1681830 RepID=UPI0006D79D3E|nr:YlxR family protein [Pseudanabaena sp. 'Roaring Creek']